MLLRHNLHQVVPLSIYYLCFVAYYLVAIIHNTLCLFYNFDLLPFLKFEKIMAILKKTGNYGSIENVSHKKWFQFLKIF